MFVHQNVLDTRCWNDHIKELHPEPWNHPERGNSEISSVWRLHRTSVEWDKKHISLNLLSRWRYSTVSCVLVSEKFGFPSICCAKESIQCFDPICRWPSSSMFVAGMSKRRRRSMTLEMPFRPLDGWSRRTASPEFFEFRQVFIVCRTFTYSFPPEPVPKFSVCHQGWFGSVGHSGSTVAGSEKDGSFSKKETIFCDL